MFSPIRAAPLQSLITRPIIQAIFAGQLPGGTRLIEQELAQQFQISRAPVREALREIASLGLIELRQNRGAVVLPFNPDSLRGIYRVRLALESEAVRLAAGRLPASELEKFETTFAGLLSASERNHAWSEKEIASDEAFHEAIATWAGVARLAMEIKSYFMLIHEIRTAQGRRYHVQETAVEQHLEILRNLREGNGEAGAGAMRRHILDAAEGAVAALFSSTEPQRA